MPLTWIIGQELSVCPAIKRTQWYQIPGIAYISHNMGNSPSSTLTSTAGPSRRPLRRKRSALLSHLGLGCASSIESSESLVTSQETSKLVFNEKINDRYRDSPNTPIAYSPDDPQMDSEEEQILMNFLQEYPGKIFGSNHFANSNLVQNID